MNGGSGSLSGRDPGGGGINRIGDFNGVIYGNMIANFTPEQPRRGSRGVFAVDVSEITAATVLSVKIQHRNRAATLWEDVVTFGSITTTGVKVKAAEELKELVRLSLMVSSGGGGDISARVKIFEPTWQA